MDNGRKADKAQVIVLQRDRSDAHSILPSRHDNTLRGKAIPTNAAALTDLRDTGWTTMIAQNHCQTGSPTFNGAQLHNVWHSAPPHIPWTIHLLSSNQSIESVNNESTRRDPFRT